MRPNILVSLADQCGKALVAVGAQYWKGCVMHGDATARSMQVFHQPQTPDPDKIVENFRKSINAPPRPHR